MNASLFPCRSSTPADETPVVHEHGGLLGAQHGPNRRLPEFIRHVRRRWYLHLPILAIWALAYVRVFVDPSPQVPLLFNWTGSLPCHVAWRQAGPRTVQRGDYIVFAFDGEARRDYPGLAGQPFFKIVRGVPGDTITVSERVVSINGTEVGRAKTHAADRRALEPIEPTVIPPGHYYVQGTDADSFDSRYRSSGLVRADQVLASVVPLL
ncbi:conjugative transfer signal peptidase TraF [Aquabacterium humicola]|uniref:conjugative transfer signal peptidase TraF n=1 Tax=Aquabacterium humicola TaxID=3237377 RepID=UPI002542B565|nr:conjugative transfer signal peptidase TraF [Rubrivivax pictus]